jgi:hypothetical protein
MMIYLEYDSATKTVVQIHEQEPILSDGYDYAISENIRLVDNNGDEVIHNKFKVGDEFERTIWITEVDENKNIVSYSTIRNNPQARRLLEENQQLKVDNDQLRLEMAQSNTELFEMMIAMSGGTA